VRAGERLRLRLINAANARIFALEFQDHRPMVIALDGQPVAPHEPAGGRVILGPAMRADLVFDMTGRPGERFTVIDPFYRGLEYRLLDLVYSDEPPLRPHPLDASMRLAANTMPEPDLRAAERHEVSFGGGMMGGMMTSGGMMGGGMMRGMQHAGIWSINGVAATGHVMEPFLTLQRDRSYVLAMHNDTAWHHPMHLHGHSFRVTSRNGAPTPHREWRTRC
jgi:FtsP/CotA-like multicopper oxidase with cupredoxin domain